MLRSRRSFVLQDGIDIRWTASMLGGTVGDMSLPLHEIAEANHRILDPFTDGEQYRPRSDPSAAGAPANRPPDPIARRVPHPLAFNVQRTSRARSLVILPCSTVSVNAPQSVVRTGVPHICAKVPTAGGKTPVMAQNRWQRPEATEKGVAPTGLNAQTSTGRRKGFFPRPATSWFDPRRNPMIASQVDRPLGNAINPNPPAI